MTGTPSPSATPSRQTSWWKLAAWVGAIWALTQAVNAWQDYRQAQQLEAILSQHPAQAGDVVMYSTSTCPYCAQARAWMSRHHVLFTECNVETSPACKAEFDRQGAPGVPLMKVRGQWGLGFDAQWMTLALQSATSPQAKPKADSSPRP